MCDARRHRGPIRRDAIRRGATIAMFTLCGVRLASAQARDARPVAERFVESRRRLDSLTGVYNAQMRAADSAAPAPMLTEGLIRVRYDSSVRASTLALIREACRRANARIVAVQGDAAAGTIGGVEFVAHELRQKELRTPLLHIRMRAAPRAFPFIGALPTLPSRVAEYFQSAAADIATNLMLTGRDDQRLGRIPSALPTPEGWTVLAVWTASATSTVARRCMTGHLNDCRRILLTSPAHARLEDWYEVDDYPALVAQRSWVTASADQRETARRCIADHDREACSDAAHRMLLPYPVPIGAAGESLVALALERGGDRALSRMLSARADDLARVEAAAGAPMDTLVAEWQRRVAAARPTHELVAPLLATLWFSTLVLVISMRRPTCA